MVAFLSLFIAYIINHLLIDFGIIMLMVMDSCNSWFDPDLSFIVFISNQGCMGAAFWSLPPCWTRWDAACNLDERLKRLFFFWHCPIRRDASRYGQIWNNMAQYGSIPLKSLTHNFLKLSLSISPSPHWPKASMPSILPSLDLSFLFTFCPRQGFLHFFFFSFLVVHLHFDLVSTIIIYTII